MFNISILSIFLYLLIGLVLLVLKPLFKMILLKIKYGKKLYMMYFPLLGRIIEFNRGTKKFNDLLHFEKTIPKDHPEIEVLI